MAGWAGQGLCPNVLKTHFVKGPASTFTTGDLPRLRYSTRIVDVLYAGELLDSAFALLSKFVFCWLALREGAPKSRRHNFAPAQLKDGRTV